MNNKLKLEGKVKSGLNESSLWLSKFEKLYTKKTGLKLYPGSLNVELKKDFFFSKDCIRIELEEFGGKGSVILLQECKIFGRKAFILRTVPYSNNKMLEIVTDVKLRDLHNLKDNDKVEIEIDCKNYTQIK